MKIRVRALAFGTAAAALYAAVSTTRAAHQTSRYVVRRSSGPFELRDYPLLRVASVVAGPEDRDSSFRRLFRFIQRGNSQRRKIPMTTPVFIDRPEESGDPTSSGTMSIVLPDALKARDLPAPIDDQVTIGERPADTVAVYRFSGRTSNVRERRAIDTLREWIEREGLDTMGPATVAYYDAPWLPGPLRRNEVMFRVAQASQRSATAGSTRDARLAGR